VPCALETFQRDLTAVLFWRCTRFVSIGILIQLRQHTKNNRRNHHRTQRWRSAYRNFSTHIWATYQFVALLKAVEFMNVK